MSTGAPGITLSQSSASADGSATPLLDVRDLHVGYAGVRALHGVSLAVPEGRIVAVLGNNGAGKSTLLRAISGTLPMHGGAIERGLDQLRRGRAVRRDRPTSCAPASCRSRRAGACSPT